VESPDGERYMAAMAAAANFAWANRHVLAREARLAFDSAAHGAGRLMSRKKAKARELGHTVRRRTGDRGDLRPPRVGEAALRRGAVRL
jgi:tRNA-splicing ligase RtcB